MGEHFIPNKQRLRKVERLEIEPRDFNATTRFWRRLGFQVTVQGDPGTRKANLKAGDLRIRMTENPDRAGDRRRMPIFTLRVVVSVREFDTFVEELRGKGIDVPEPGFHHGFQRGVEVIDPNGIRVLLEDHTG